MLPAFDQVQVCTSANRDYLLSFRPELAPKLRDGLRAGIDTSRYQFRPRGREPLTMLFVGSFRHDPNRVAVDWFVREVLPHTSGAPAGRETGDRRKRPAAGPCLCRLRGTSGNVGLRGRRARAAEPVFGFCLPDPERFGGAGEVAGGLRGGHPGGFHARGGRGTGQRRTVNSAPWPTTR